MHCIASESCISCSLVHLLILEKSAIIINPDMEPVFSRNFSLCWWGCSKQNSVFLTEELVVIVFFFLDSFTPPWEHMLWYLLKRLKSTLPLFELKLILLDSGLLSSRFFGTSDFLWKVTLFVVTAIVHQRHFKSVEFRMKISLQSGHVEATKRLMVFRWDALIDCRERVRVAIQYDYLLGALRICHY